MSGRRIRVLILDDSAIVRKILSNSLSSEPDIQVVATLPDPIAARERLAELAPDVITVDIEMPKMDGITFIRELMSTTPLPCIVISSVGQHGCDRAIEALEAGAVEVLPKPFGSFSVGSIKDGLAAKIRAAAHVNLKARRSVPVCRKLSTVMDTETRSVSGALIAIGASTGGTEAIRQVVQGLPTYCPPVLIVQHIPTSFSKAFASRLNECCAIRVREAVDGDMLEPGVALVAPGDHHMTLKRAVGGFQVRLNQKPAVCYQRPSVELLFQSVAQTSRVRAMGILLTGMGNDGATGLKQMRDAGAYTIAQDEATSVVYGMPREAMRIGAAVDILPLSRISDAIINWSRGLNQEAIA